VLFYCVASYSLSVMLIWCFCWFSVGFRGALGIIGELAELHMVNLARTGSNLIFSGRGGANHIRLVQKDHLRRPSDEEPYPQIRPCQYRSSFYSRTNRAASMPTADAGGRIIGNLLDLRNHACG